MSLTAVSAPEICKATLKDYRHTDGVVVVVDVLRSFTTTAFAFAMQVESDGNALVLKTANAG